MPDVHPQSPMGGPKLVRAGGAPLPVVPLGGPQSVWVGVDIGPGTTWEDAPATAAPELSAAMAETRTIRDGYARLCQEFGPAWQSGQGARISLTVLNRHRVNAGMPPLGPREASGKPDMWDKQQAEIDQLTAERDDARAERDRHRKVLENARECLLRGSRQASDIRREAIGIVCDELDSIERASLEAS